MAPISSRSEHGRRPFPTAGHRRLLATSPVLLLAACSTFNISPRCEETAQGLQRLIAVPEVQAPIDIPRLNQLVQVGNFVETGSSYNERTCSADVTVGRRTATVRYRVRQSEGLQNWYGAELLQPDDPDLVAISAEARMAYDAGA